MSTVIEFESSSVDKAIKKACRELNLTAEELKHEIISYGSTGIFGLVGIKKARIRVTVPDAKPTEPAFQNDDRSADMEATHDDRTADTLEAVMTDPTSKDLEASLDGPIALGREALQKMIDFITTGASITVKQNGERVKYHVSGGNTGVLIGKRGQTLEAMQYLVDKVVSKRFEKRFRLQIDVEDYLKNRRANLENMAKRMGEKAKRTGKPMSFGQMSAHDRRIVHIALKADNGVRTQSMGDGYYRKLVIFPKKRNGRRKKQSS